MSWVTMSMVKSPRSSQISSSTAEASDHARLDFQIYVVQGLKGAVSEIQIPGVDGVCGRCRQRNCMRGCMRGFDGFARRYIRKAMEMLFIISTRPIRTRETS